jgi:hypothetical protein
MRENKTKPTKVSPKAFIDAVDNEQRRNDARELVAIMKAVTGKPPAMWGPSIVGFGSYSYKYASGREGTICLTGFSPRKQSLVVYLGPGLDNGALTAKLGKHKRSKGCLYINKLDDVDRGVLRELIAHSITEVAKRHR